jgi:hypothetical protein
VGNISQKNLEGKIGVKSTIFYQDINLRYNTSGIKINLYTTTKIKTQCDTKTKIKIQSC